MLEKFLKIVKLYVFIVSGFIAACGIGLIILALTELK